MDPVSLTSVRDGRRLLLAVASAFLLGGAGEPPSVRLAPVEEPEIDLDVVARRFDEARSQIQPSLGATTYSLSRQAIQAVPQADNAPLSQVLLRAPGVAQDSFGQIHVRDEHANVQYRLDGVQLPEGLAVFGQALETRFAHSFSLITGSLPAQYGFRQSAVVDIVTKSGTTDPGGEISMYGGARGLLQPSFSYGGRSGAADYFVTGDYLHSNIGIENPENRFNANHDGTSQYRGLAHISAIINDTLRLSLLTGTSRGEYQIPTVGGRTPGLGLVLNGQSSFDSSTLNEHQREITHFGILSAQKHLSDFDAQVSLFSRYSSLYYAPDPLGDLLFNGVAPTALRQSWANGLQADASLRVSESHTIRAGVLGQIERTRSATRSSVLPTDPTGAQTSDQPFAIGDRFGKTGAFYGFYVQDEWRALPGVTVNYGGRFDVVDAFSHENQFSPRINVVWQPVDGTTLHGGYSRYFTPPPLELVSAATIGKFANTSNAPAVTQDSVVRAERSHYFDIGVSQVVLPGLTVGIDAFYKIAHNLLDEGQFGAPIILTAFNYGRARQQGVEFSANYTNGPLSVYVNLAYARGVGKNITSAQFNFSASDLAYIAQHYIHLDHDQRFTASAGVSYLLNGGTGFPTLLSTDLLVGSGLRRSGDVPNGRALPGAYTINLSAVQKLDLGLWRGTAIRLDVLNLLDRRYEIRDGTGVGVGAPQYGLRRAILAGLTQRF